LYNGGLTCEVRDLLKNWCHGRVLLNYDVGDVLALPELEASAGWVSSNSDVSEFLMICDEVIDCLL
jgi:hypothetical protein